MWHAIVTLAIYIDPALVDHCLVEIKAIDEKSNGARMNQIGFGHIPAIDMVYFCSTTSAHKLDQKIGIVFEI
ncbi:MAG: hypothetical protein OEV07_13210 [Gammaproteobacteria bacterium]|nr:hypothetical protein [Gammaproteobacteria bacterium]